MNRLPLIYLLIFLLLLSANCVAQPTPIKRDATNSGLALMDGPSGDLPNPDWNPLGPPTVKAMAPAGITRHPADEALDPQAADSWFGFSIASSDSHVVVGAPRMANTRGRAYIFRRFGADLVLEATLIPADGASDDWFGYAVAIDGDTVMVAANRDDFGLATEVGSVYVFERNGSNWPQVAKLFPANQMATSNFGFAVAIQGDEAFIGAISVGAPTYPGGVFRYRRQAGVWVETGLILPANTQNAQWFGYRLALQGNTLVVAAPLFDGGAPDVGRALVFERTNNVWSEVAELSDITSQNREWFGQGLAISGDRIAISAFDRPVQGVQAAGAAMIYERQNGVWTPQPVQTLTASPPVTADNFGISLAMDGPQLWVGMRAALRPPAVWTYRMQAGQWQQTQVYSPPPPTDNFYGVFSESISVRPDALFVGAPRQRGISGLSQVGAVHRFVRTAIISTQNNGSGQILPNGPTEWPIGDLPTFIMAPDLGFHLVSVSGCDGVLNGPAYQVLVADDCTITATFGNDPPVAISLNVDGSHYESEPINLSVVASDPEGATLSYRFDCDGDGSFDVGPQTDPTGICVLPHAGVYTAVAEVTDLGGLSASRSGLVTALNSAPTITFGAPIVVQEDASFMVSTTATVPSTGEQVVLVQLDCNFDSVSFDVDVSGIPNTALPCPGFPLSGTQHIAARAQDSEGEWGLIVNGSVAVSPVNDPPTFELIGNQSHGPGVVGTFEVIGFVHSVSAGPIDEQNQQIIAIQSDEVSDSNEILTSVSIDLEGRLHYQLSGRAGTAVVAVRLTDNGGEPGQATSGAQHFSISNTAGTDLAVAVLEAPGQVVQGGEFSTRFQVQNLGPNDATGQFQIPLITGLGNLTWNCQSAQNAVCPIPAQGIGAVDVALSLPAGAIMEFELVGLVTASEGQNLSAQAGVEVIDTNQELNQANNNATETWTVVSALLFKNGFE